jgi:hypothetical protein
LPEQDIDDGLNDPQVLRALNKDLAKRRESWLNKFKLNQQPSAQQSQSVAQFPSAGVQPPAAQVPILPPSCPRPFKVQESKTAELVCTFLLQKTIPHNFTKALAVQGFFAEYYLLSQYSNRTPLFEAFATLSTSNETIFNNTCQSVLEKLLPTVRNMIIAAEKYAVALEQAELKETELAILEEENAKERAKKGKSQGKKKKKKNKKTRKHTV